MTKVESFWCHEARNIRCVRESDYAALEQECEGLKAQHARDSAELRSLCQARDDARRQRDAALLQVEALRELLRDAQWCMQSIPSCQSGIVARCGCRKCVHARIDAALQAKP